VVIVQVSVAALDGVTAVRAESAAKTKGPAGTLKKDLTIRNEYEKRGRPHSETSRSKLIWGRIWESIWGRMALLPSGQKFTN
jgi:hypothetical protein